MKKEKTEMSEHATPHAANQRSAVSPLADHVQHGAENALHCLGVTDQDRVFILTDYPREAIARRVASAALARHAGVTVRFLEHYGARPLMTFPAQLRQELEQAHPTVSFYIA